MDVVRLGERYTTSYVPDELIEGYSSMIFTERHETPGDFQLKTYAIADTAALLPEDTLISVRGSDDVHMVEDLDIDVDDFGRPQLVVTGRSLDFYIDHRFVESGYQKKREMRKDYSPLGAAAVLLYNAFDNNSGKDVTRGDKVAKTPELNDYSWNLLDRIPNICITDSSTDDGEIRSWFLNEGMLGEQLRNILIKGDLGLRMIRPSSGSSAQIVTVKSTLAERGDIVRTMTNGIKSMRFDLYKGLDRTINQSVNPRVQFRVLHNDLDRIKRFRSKKDYKTAVEIMSGVGGADVYRNNTERDYSGLRRRVMAYDGGTPDLPPEPQKPDELRKNATKDEREDRADAMDKWLDDHAEWANKRDNIVTRFKNANDKAATRELSKARRINMLSGDVSPSAPYKFKVDYNLGDKVTLVDEDGFTQTMVVAEYIRTEDDEGDHGYPGLVEPEA